jgi:hypothetical protein
MNVPSALVIASPLLHSSCLFVQGLREIHSRITDSPCTVSHIVGSGILDTFQCHALDLSGLHLAAHGKTHGGADVFEGERHSRIVIVTLYLMW